MRHVLIATLCQDMLETVNMPTKQNQVNIEFCELASIITSNFLLLNIHYVT
jgi:hypothetical protein